MKGLKPPPPSRVLTKLITGETKKKENNNISTARVSNSKSYHNYACIHSVISISVCSLVCEGISHVRRKSYLHPWQQYIIRFYGDKILPGNF